MRAYITVSLLDGTKWPGTELANLLYWSRSMSASRIKKESMRQQERDRLIDSNAIRQR